MWIGAALVTLLVTILMIVPFVRRVETVAHRKVFLWGGGVALPLIALLALVPYAAGLVLWVPVMALAIYTSYRDVFAPPPAAAVAA